VKSVCRGFEGFWYRKPRQYQFDGEDVDLAAGRLRVARSKTDAGIRDIALLPVLREELSTLKARLTPEPDALVFGTSSGSPNNPTNIRQRVLQRAITRANEKLSAQNGSPLSEGLTLHSFRTHLCIAPVCDRAKRARGDGAARTLGRPPHAARIRASDE
jgi:integrase